MTDLKMPERQPTDGPVGVTRVGTQRLAIEAVDDGVAQAVYVSEYNAWRLLGMLSVMLGVPLSPAAMKAIKL